MEEVVFVVVVLTGGLVARVYSQRTNSSKACGSSSGRVSWSSKVSLKPELKADLKKSEEEDRRFSWRRHVVFEGPTRMVTTRSEKSLEGVSVEAVCGTSW